MSEFFIPQTYEEQLAYEEELKRLNGQDTSSVTSAMVTNGEASTASPASTAVDTAPYLDPDSAAFYGLAGEIVRAIEPYTEADPAGLLGGVLVRFGSMVGPMAETRVGHAHHPPCLFSAMVGRSSRSRKDSANWEISGVFENVEDGWRDRHEIGGFGSGEALIERATKQPDESILMIESEFSRVLATASRDGSTVSQVLRSAWDFRRMEHRIRGKDYAAPPTPVSLVGHITADELKDRRNGLRPVEIMNGFGNRILWIYVDRRRIDPRGTSLPQASETALVRRLHDVLIAAREARNPVERSGAAEDLWADLYARMANDDGLGIIGQVTARAEAQVLRLSLIYALLDGVDVIGREHLEAAWEFWRYCRWSAQHIWVGSGTGDPDLDRIADVLSGGGRLSREALDRMFQGHRSTADLRERAVEAGIAAEVREPSGGRDRVYLAAVDAVDAVKGPRWWISTAFTASTAAISKEGGER
jgi:Protein of unknown function (DUF3987)